MKIPVRFAETIAAHLVMNVICPPGIDVPLVLGIHGPMGEGKTAMCHAVLERMGVLPVPIFADKFESVDAGEPAQEVLARYLRAATINADIAEGRHVPLASRNGAAAALAALSVDDLDQRIGSNPEVDVQQTQNTSLINAALMELADNPEIVDGVKVHRTPIIVTANHLDWIYQPVVRPGRMTAFHWTPTLDERVEMVSGIYPELAESDVAAIVNDHPALAITSFAAARYHLYADAVRLSVREKGLDKALVIARDARWLTSLSAPTIDPRTVRDSLGAVARHSGISV